MRQAGVLARRRPRRPRHHVDRLADDHAGPGALADAVADAVAGRSSPSPTVRTNMVVFRHPTAPALLAHLDAAGRAGRHDRARRVRLVTHLDVDDAGDRLRASPRCAP